LGQVIMGGFMVMVLAAGLFRQVWGCGGESGRCTAC
jgi:hypothetical protein